MVSIIDSCMFVGSSSAMDRIFGHSSSNKSIGIIVFAFILHLLGDIKSTAHSKFVKSVNDIFPSQVYKRGSDIPSDLLDEKILVQDAIEFTTEFRCFISDRELISISPYLKDGQLHMESSEKELDSARIFAYRILCTDIDMPPSFVLDVGKLATDKWAIVDVNPAAEKQTGYTWDELVGKNIIKLLCAEEIDDVLTV